MGLIRVTPAQAWAHYANFDAVVDARSESEFAEDRLPGAVNWPVLNDEQRALVGTEYKQVSAFDARKRGAVLATLNIARHLQDHVAHQQRSWRPLVYCWRGGQRSGSLALVLSEVGFNVHVLDGGYRGFRREVLTQLEAQPAALNFTVLCGPTGSAKSRLLQQLAQQGAQVVDLEALACHRGSVLGPEPGQAQPTQKAFETAVWHTLGRLDSARPVFAESESRTIGRLRVPEALLLRLRAAPCVRVHMGMPQRVRFLLRDYAHFVDNAEHFCAQLEPLRALRGADTVTRWQAMAREQAASGAGESGVGGEGVFTGPLFQVVQELLEQHYDPAYMRSMQRNYLQFGQALDLDLGDASASMLAERAAGLLAAGS